MNGNDNRDGILKNLNGALKSKKLYPPGHPAIAAQVRKGYELINDSLKTRRSIAIGVVNEALVFEDHAVEGYETLYPDIIQYMGARNVDTIMFEKGMTEKELSSLVNILTQTEPLKGAQLQKELHAQGVTHITLKSIPAGKKNALEIYNGAVEVVKSVMNEVRMGKIPRSGPVNSIVDEISESILTDPNAIIGLTMIKNYDNYLYNHSVNVSVLSISLARAMGINGAELHAVGVAALLHDIGKTGVAEDIIRKPGGLSSEEWEKIKQHPLLGSNIIKRMEGVEELVGRLIYEHHVKYDHSGYPENTRNLHPYSQIISISDAYDALTTLRVYQQPHNPADAVKVMNNFSGRHFDPATLKAFVSMLGVFPVGTMVRLTTNEIGLVIRVNASAPDSPTVKILYDKDGAQLSAPFEVDLATEASAGRGVVTAVNPAMTNIDIAEFFEKEAV